MQKRKEIVSFLLLNFVVAVLIMALALTLIKGLHL